MCAHACAHLTEGIFLVLLSLGLSNSLKNCLLVFFQDGTGLAASSRSFFIRQRGLLSGWNGFQHCVYSYLIPSIVSMILLPSPVTHEPPDQRPFVALFPEIYTRVFRDTGQFSGASNWNGTLGIFLLF